MFQSMPIIRTKLLVPDVKIESIRRAALTKKMKSISRYPLTIIHSGAGYGKSTALALFVKDEKKGCSWYSISPADDDILPFLSYLISSVQFSFPEFGKNLAFMMKDMDRYIREEEINMLSSLFINELLSIEKELFIILDDFHQIEQSYTVNRWMEKLLDHIPPNIHFIISSRSRPMWKQLTKMKVCNQLLEITKDDLIMTMDEAELLLNDYYDINVNEGELAQIYALTEGWVIAIGMIAQQIPENGDFSNLHSKSSQSLQDLFQYLALEVFAKQPPMIQQFLEQTCIFDELSEEICDSVLGITGSSSILHQIIEKNLFIYRIGEKQFKYHALFKEFLENQLKEKDPETFRSLHERTARFFEQRKQWEEALLHYEKIQYSDAVASVLNEVGFRMLENGKLENLYDRLLFIPDTEKDIFYPLWFLQGEVLRYCSKYNEAEACYIKAAQMAEKKNNLLEKSRALEGQAKIYLDTIQPHKAERILFQAIEIREKNDIQSKDETAKLYHLLAENLLNSGQYMKAEKWIKRAGILKGPQFNNSLEARLYLRTGRFSQARNILLNEKKREGAEKTPLPQSHRETDILLSLIEGLTGNGNQAKLLAQEGIQHGISIKAPFVEACGWMRMGHAIQIVNDYDLSLAEKCYETALDIMNRLRIERGKAEPLMGLCLLYGSRGEFERAIAAGEAALVETEKVKDIWLSALIQLAMGISAVYSKHYSYGSKYLQKASSHFNECGDQYGSMLCLYWQTYISFSQNELSSLLELLPTLLKEVQTGEYEFIFNKRTMFGPRDLQMFAPILIEAQRQTFMPQLVARLLQEMNLSKVDFHPGYTLRVSTLGRFQIWLGEKEVEEKDWQRGKAKELLQLFITNPHKLIPKEQIYQLLWTDQDEKSAARDFKVALNALNNVLEPNRKARRTPFFIMREGAAYGLNPHAVLEVDSQVFEQWITAGLEDKTTEKAMSYLEKGLKMYKGDYLPERRFDDWCLNEKERLSVFFIRAAEKLAQLYVRSEEYDKAIHWCSKILEKDRTWEEAYRLTMYCYYRKNNRPFALKWYQKCCEILEEELGVPPLDPTRHMYEMILESGNTLHSVRQP
ncbi:BTAD domain-containing putative transcriptional regulator [Bacillus sp. FJAT-29937]|uniref:BTAD domain-containing putative transcriptional regulator n=1 Tax=Bacillus sp. FJAT-29937 TaxID=1720553 RepID=UPI000AA662B0|nr:BTAD domain-containing putative transcriptional regulator [Bacillus sp. FJAT-29937]